MNEIDATNFHIVRNEGDEPLHCYQYGPVDPSKKFYDETPLAPKHVRVYEFLHGWEDIPIRDYDIARVYEQVDPLMKIFRQELQKEIDRSVIQTIADNAKNADPFDVQEWMRKRGHETS